MNGATCAQTQKYAMGRVGRFGRSCFGLMKQLPIGVHLEVKLQRQLDLARSDSSAKYLPEVLIVNCGIRRGEHRVIECILRFEPELYVHLLANRELFTDREIGDEGMRAADAAQRSWCIAHGEISRTLEHAVISKIVVHPVRAVIAS